MIAAQASLDSQPQGPKHYSKPPEESYYRRNLCRVSHVQAMDKAQESIVVAALARLRSHFHVYQAEYPFKNNISVQKLKECLIK